MKQTKLSIIADKAIRNFTIYESIVEKEIKKHFAPKTANFILKEINKDFENDKIK